MRYYKYPHKSEVTVASAIWIIFCILVLLSWEDISPEGLAVVSILQAGAIMALRLIDVGEIVVDARGGWRGV